MKARIQLWLKNYLFDEIEIDMRENSDQMSSEQNIDLNAEYVKLKAKEILSIFYPQIEKCGGNYQMFVQVESKGNFIAQDHDFT